MKKWVAFLISLGIVVAISTFFYFVIPKTSSEPTVSNTAPSNPLVALPAGNGIEPLGKDAKWELLTSTAVTYHGDRIAFTSVLPVGWYIKKSNLAFSATDNVASTTDPKVTDGDHFLIGTSPNTMTDAQFQTYLDTSLKDEQADVAKGGVLVGPTQIKTATYYGQRREYVTPASSSPVVTRSFMADILINNRHVMISAIVYGPALTNDALMASYRKAFEDFISNLVFL